jgi:hypothetical protein
MCVYVLYREHILYKEHTYRHLNIAAGNGQVEAAVCVCVCVCVRHIENKFCIENTVIDT